MLIGKDHGIDAAVLDREDHAVALVQVKSRPLGDEWTRLLRSDKRRISESFPNAAFLLAIDPKYIHLYRLTEKEVTDPVVHLDTAKVLGHYDPDFSKERIFENYLITLVEAWLRDLAYHWKSPSPPGSNELKAAGLLSKVEGGTTRPLGD
jgi:hypothetical protein